MRVDPAAAIAVFYADADPASAADAIIRFRPMPVDPSAPSGLLRGKTIPST